MIDVEREASARPAEPSAATDGGGPHWLSDAVHNAKEEIFLFVATAVGIALRPGRFAAAWVRREQRALNPLAFMATSATILAVSRLVTGPIFAALGADKAEPPLPPILALLRQAWDAVSPHANFLLLGLLAHLFCRLFGSRAKLRDSAAVALFAGGGPVAFAELVLTSAAAFLLSAPGAVTKGRPTAPGTGTLLVLAALASFLIFVATFGVALAAVHRAARRSKTILRTTAALLCAYAVSGVIYGALQPPGNFGLHFDIAWKKNAQGKRELSVQFKA